MNTHKRPSTGLARPERKDTMHDTRKPFIVLLAAIAVLALFASRVSAKQPPNILVIWGDDIGQFNVSA